MAKLTLFYDGSCPLCVREMADKLYLLLARNRYRISFLLTGKSRCDCSR
ncbi:hypothetical protein PK654_18435 [Vibrio sp. SCSIO 43137]|nr:hypothetical protein [Vibrio sp. SCSIO 43137]WCE32470.1 hypothetical protein PK654_18435 [Vibrio sp. SCSIO 43137]